MRGFLKTVALAGAWLLASHAYGAETFETTLSRMVFHSPTLRSAVLAVDASIADASTAANLPDPEVEGEYMWAGDGGEDKWNAGISWSLEWPGVYGARRKLSKSEQERYILEWQVRKQETVRELYGLMLDYIGAGKRLEVVERLLASTDSLSSYTELAVANGTMTALDSSKLRIERSRLALRKGEEEQAMESARTSIVAIAGKEGAVYMENLAREFPASPLLSEDEYLKALEKSPKILLSVATVEIAARSQKVSTAESLPGISVGYTHAFEEGIHFNGGRLGLSIPVFSSRGKQKAARLHKEAAEFDLNSELDALVAETRGAWKQARALEESIRQQEGIFSDRTPQELLDKMLHLGRITLLEYLQERNYYYEAELDYISLRERYHRLRVPLETIDMNGIGNMNGRRTVGS